MDAYDFRRWPQPNATLLEFKEDLCAGGNIGGVEKIFKAFNAMAMLCYGLYNPLKKKLLCFSAANHQGVKLLGYLFNECFKC